MNDRIAEHRETVEAIALRLSRGAVARRVGADYDDLAQEGLLQVWQNLERGVTPLHYIEYRMQDYMKWLGLQTGVPRNCEIDPDTGEILNPVECAQHVPYNTLLPLDDFRIDTRNTPFPDAAQL